MNQLPGRIAAVEVCGSVALVDVMVGECRCTATLLGVSEEASEWQVGTPVTLLFKETEVALAKDLSGLISLRNRLKGVVTAIERGQVLCKVELDIGGHAISSIITTRSSWHLQLAVGDEVEGLVKANEMNLMLEPR